MNTALVNHNVPVALICTDQFAKLKARVEKRTGWTSEQLEHRVKRYKKLSNTPTQQDLEALAAKLLAMRWNTAQQRWEIGGVAPHRDFITMIVGYALTCKMPIAAVSDTIMEARYQARKNSATISLQGTFGARFLTIAFPLMQRYNKLSSLLRSGGCLRSRLAVTPLHLPCNVDARALHSDCKTNRGVRAPVGSASHQEVLTARVRPRGLGNPCSLR